MAALAFPGNGHTRNQGHSVPVSGCAASSTPKALVNSANYQKPASGGKPVSENMNTANTAAVSG